MKKVIQKLIDYYLAKTGKFDFCQECLFSSQINYKRIGRDLYSIPMESGRVAIYRLKTEELPGRTGQADYYFTFVKFI